MAGNRSLHIGVNYLDPLKYPFEEFNEKKHALFYANGEGLEITDKLIRGWKGPLGTPEGKLGCEKDAEAMANIARAKGFEPTILSTEEATAKRVLKEYEDALDALESGNIFFVTFAGHGGHAKDINDDEPDGYDETWFLYDRMLLDDEQRVLYSKFGKKGIRIVVLMDCCHSASSFRGTNFDSTEVPPGVEVRGAPGEVDAWIYKYEPNKKLYNEIQATLPIVDEYHGVISISACRDDQIAMGGPKDGGWFSNAVAAAFKDGESNGNHVQFFERVNQELQKAHPGARQEPTMAHPLSKHARKVLLEEGRKLTDEEWAKEVKILNQIREKHNEDVEKENRKRKKFNEGLEAHNKKRAEDKKEPEEPKKLKELKPYPIEADELAQLRDLADFLAEEFLPEADSA